MRPWRFLRGALSTALVWATTWAVVGGLVNAALVVVTNGAAPWLSSPSSLFRVALSSASAFGMAGALVGLVFAAALAVGGRRISFAELTGRRVLIVGALGGLAVAGSIYALRVLLIGVPARGFLPDFVLAGALGAATAWSSLRIARRAPARSPSELGTADVWGAERAHDTRESLPAVPTE